ncbi:MAG: hypothetical protein JO250_05905 [Armatimonadetes bacterium]|nr:hypothetical protein [Armatimonadota bacterium]
MKLISTRMHGLLDYLTAVKLYALPGLLGWDEKATGWMRSAAAATLLYSLVTEYEWGFGPLKVLPMRVHLALDGVSGALFCAAPWLLPEEPTDVKSLLAAVGIFELLVTLNSQTEPQTGDE